MFVLAFFSSYDDSVIFDETAHIGAGYSYITEFDMRLNPEHPPLFKDLAALPLLTQNLNFRTDTDAWQNKVNGQWDAGGGLIFEYGNDPQKIIRLSRLPIMLMSVLVGFLFFFWARRHFGKRVALLGAFFYAFSPTVIAHSRFVTTDIAAALGFLIGISTFVDFLETRSKKHLIVAGLAFGIAQSLKFSLFLLGPISIVLAILWAYSNRMDIKNFGKLAGQVLLIFIIGALLVWLIYIPHVWNYPQEKQLSDAKTLISTFKVKPFVDLDLWLIKNDFTRPLGHYLMGVMMVTQRTAGGNSAYFWGEVSADGWPHYFPIVYLLKETLGFHILTLMALVLAFLRIKRKKERGNARDWIRNNFALTATLFFVGFYWILTIFNPLNIGIRHLLPIFPFVYILVAREIIIWISGGEASYGNLMQTIKSLYKNFVAPAPKIMILALIMLWISGSVLLAFPFYLSYYNELAGGTLNGYKIATDSNYDWGQDLKRLANKLEMDYPEEDTVYLHYFGGSSQNSGAQQYYLGDKFKAHYSSFGPPPSGSLFAISVNELMGLWATPVAGFPEQEPQNSYEWLKPLEPIDRGGTSIFIYRIP